MNGILVTLFSTSNTVIIILYFFIIKVITMDDEFNYELERHMKIKLEMEQDLARNNIPPDDSKAIDDYLLGRVD